MFVLFILLFVWLYLTRDTIAEYWLTTAIKNKFKNGFDQLNDDKVLDAWYSESIENIFFSDQELSSYTTSKDLSFALVNKIKSDTKERGEPEFFVIG